MLKKLIILVVLVLVSTPLFAQVVDTAWVRMYNGPLNNWDQAYAIAVDSYGNVYVTGLINGFFAYSPDFATIKYTPNGDTAWVRIYNGPLNWDDWASDIAVDSSGNVYVTGPSWGSWEADEDFLTIKYSPNGDTAWIRRYNGPGTQNAYDEPHAMAVDASGNVYVTGGSDNDITSIDYLTIKYDADGNELWVRRYNGPGNGRDDAQDIAVDGSGNVYVTGYSYDVGDPNDYATIKYDPNGDTAWVRRYTNGNGWAWAIAVDSPGNVYVTGSVGTIKYDTYGNQLWVGPGGGFDNTVDTSGNVYASGWAGGWDQSDWYTTKYYPNGDIAWVRTYNSPGLSDDRADDIAVDNLGNVYVTGSSYDSEKATYRATTIKYYPNGDTAWIIKDSRPESYSSGAYAITVEDVGNVYVTGYSCDSSTISSCDYLTIRYLPVFEPPGVDLRANLWGDRRARRGFQKTYQVTYSNVRTDNAENVVLSVILPQEVQFVSCNPPCNVNGQNISWALGSVAGLTFGSASVKFYIPTSVLSGTILKGIVEITTTSDDQTPMNNRSKEEERVVTSWDPNDKEAQPWGGGSAKYIMPDQTLRYTIFFENDSSATAEAIYIDVVDTLDANLDWSTLEIGPMSYPDTCEASFDPISGVLTWHCDSIMLPPNVNPPEGEGFVSFSIMPDSGMASGTQIKNRAYIKFDYNPWIAAPDSGTVVRTIGKFGDANADGLVTVSDVIYLINYLFKGGIEPVPYEAGDVNCDGKVTVADVVYLINYLFKGGPSLGC